VTRGRNRRGSRPARRVDGRATRSEPDPTITSVARLPWGRTTALATNEQPRPRVAGACFAANAISSGDRRWPSLWLSAPRFAGRSFAFGDDALPRLRGAALGPDERTHLRAAGELSSASATCGSRVAGTCIGAPARIFDAGPRALLCAVCREPGAFDRTGADRLPGRVVLLANTGSLGSSGASPAWCWREVSAARSVLVAACGPGAAAARGKGGAGGAAPFVAEHSP
jgi:hypothetical protein